MIHMYQKCYKILELYLKNFKEKYYLREIANLADLPIRTTQRILRDLESEGIIKAERVGKNKYFFLNMLEVKTKILLTVAELYRTLDFVIKYPAIKMFLKEQIDQCLVVFGSFAKFKATKTSDFDLLIIGDSKRELPLYLIPYKVHQIKLRKKDFERFIRKETLGKEILKNHLVLTKHSYFVDMLWQYYEKT